VDFRLVYFKEKTTKLQLELFLRSCSTSSRPPRNVTLPQKLLKSKTSQLF